MTEPANDRTDTPLTLPIGPPPVGLVISSLLDWQAFSHTYPGMDRYWQPADGRELPQDSVLARVLASHGRPARFLPDLRGAVLRGASANPVPGDKPARLATSAADEPGVRTHQVYFYVRCN